MYDVICESVQSEMPGEQRGAGDRVIKGMHTYAAAQRHADEFVRRFGHLPGVRVLIWDRRAQSSIVVHDAE